MNTEINLNSENTNYNEFLEFLNLVPSNGKEYYTFFKLQHFAFWINKFEDVDLKVTILFSNNYSLSCNIPNSEVWIEIINAYSKENLLEKIFKNGLEKIHKIFEEYSLLNKIGENQKLTIEEFENKKNLSLFWLEHSVGKIFSIWKYQKETFEIISRIGKDNRIESNCFEKYYVVIGNEIINDDYLESLLPKENTTHEIDYGYVASQTKSITEKITKDLATSKLFLEKYNDILHYKFLTKKGKKIKLKDSEYYKV